MRVLVVDDELNIRNLVCKYLELEKFETDAAENGPFRSEVSDRSDL